jgi:hypothetical protein
MMSIVNPDVEEFDQGHETAATGSLLYSLTARGPTLDAAGAKRHPSEDLSSKDEHVQRNKKQRYTEDEHQVKNLVLSTICERCSKTPWKSIASGDGPNQVIVRESILNLQLSQCHICRLLGHFLLLRRAAPPSYQMSRPTWANDFPGPHLIQSSSFCTDSHVLWYPSTKLRIMVSECDPYQLYNNLGHFHPYTLDLKTIQIWISSCKSQHTTGCCKRSSGFLKKLQVIDCKREEVVSAPLQCRYAALSYVWGDASFSTGLVSSSLQDAPSTVSDAIDLAKGLGYRYLWVDRYVSRRCSNLFAMSDQYSASLSKTRTSNINKLPRWVESTQPQT